MNRILRGIYPFGKLVWYLRLILEKLRMSRGGGTSASLCRIADRLPENSPTHTPNVDEESSGLCSDRRFERKLTSVCATPALLIYCWRLLSCNPF